MINEQTMNEQWTKDKQTNNERTMNNQAMNEQTTMDKQMNNEQTNER